jgi:hypothetical protein
MALPTGGYSYSPQTANLGASPLSALKPLDVGVSVQFTPMPKYEVPSAQQELVSMGAAKGFQGFAEPVFAAIKEKADEKKAEELLEGKYAHEEKIAGIRAAKTPEEKEYEKDYRKYRIEALKGQVEKQKDGDKEEPITYGTFEDNDAAAGEDLENLDPSGQGMWNLQPDQPEVLDEYGNNLFGVVSPTPQEVQSLWSKPLSELTAASPAGTGQVAQLAAMQAGQIPVPSQDMSTDVQARPLPVTFDMTSKYKGLITPDQAQEIGKQFYKATGEQMSQPSLANMPTPVAQARKEAPQATTQNLGNYLKTWADPDVAAKAQQKISEIMGSNYAPAEIEEITTKTGERGFKVKYPKKLSAKEIADLKKSAREEAGAKKEKLQQFQLQSFENVNRAQGTLDDLEKQLDKVQDKLGPISGRIMAQNPYDTDVQLLNKFLTALIPTIARGVYGEVGVLTEADINNYKNLIPNITQDAANAKATLEFLKRDIQRAKETKLNIWEASNFDIEGLKKFNTPTVSVESNLKQQVQSKIKELQSYPLNSEQRLKAASELNALRQQLTGSK